MKKFSLSFIAAAVLLVASAASAAPGSQQPWSKIEFVTYLMDGWHANHGMAAVPVHLG